MARSGEERHLEGAESVTQAGEYEERTVRPSEVQRGDFIHTSRTTWARVDQHGKDEHRSFFWLDGHYYPIAIDGGALVTVRSVIGRTGVEQ